MIVYMYVSIKRIASIVLSRVPFQIQNFTTGSNVRSGIIKIIGRNWLRYFSSKEGFWYKLIVRMKIGREFRYDSRCRSIGFEMYPAAAQ